MLNRGSGSRLPVGGTSTRSGKSATTSGAIIREGSAPSVSKGLLDESMAAPVMLGAIVYTILAVASPSRTSAGGHRGGRWPQKS